MFTLARSAGRSVALALVLTAASLMGSTVASGFGETPTGPFILPRQRLQELFDAMPAATRLKLVEKVVGAKPDFQPVVRADLAAVVVARGSLMSAMNNDVYCTVRTGVKGGSATTIKWLIDNGTPVKKGELVAELDDAVFVVQLKEQQIKLDLARADLVKAKEDLDLAARETEGQLLTCDIEIRTAEMSLKKHGNDDPDEKDILKLHIERARLNLARHKVLGRSRETHAQAVVEAKKAGLDGEQGRYRDIEQQIQACRIVAPQDGLAVHYVPEQVRGGGSQASVVAQGEPVREGQKLLQIPDLSRMILVTRVPEALIAQVRIDQTAAVAVDAFPLKHRAGRVQWVDTVAAQADFFSSDVKVFHVHVLLAAGMAELKPGMSAEVRIETARADGVLVVPVHAVVRAGAKSYCYVKSGQEIRKAEVVPGLRDDFRVEIKAGLKEGDNVLRDPIGVLRRVIQVPAPPLGGAPKQTSTQPVRLHVRSVRVVDAGRAPGKWVETYGLTYDDLRAIAAMPSVVDAVPVRRFPHESRRLDRVQNSIVVGATPELADLLPLPLEAGRFLCTQDMEERRSVVVLGAAVADELFPGDDALGRSIVLNKEHYVVIGVLVDGNAGDAASAAERRASIYLPLTTCQSRFGERVIVRSAGMRRAEAVQLSDIYVTAESPQDVVPTLEAIRELLAHRHAQNDWAVRVGD